MPTRRNSDLPPDLTQLQLERVRIERIIDPENRAVLKAMVDGFAGGDARPWICLATVEPESVDWLWDGRIPLGKVTILEGDPDEGKSCVALDIAARVTTGMSMPNTIAINTEAMAPAGCVYVTGEDGLGDTVRPRLDAAGGDPARVMVFDFDTLPELSAEGLEVMQAAITDCSAKLLVLDPLNAFLPDAVDSHVDKSVRRALRPLAALADRTGIAVLVIRHLKKSGGTNAKYRGGGSIGIIAAARSAMLAAPDPADPTRKVLAMVKHNLSAPVPSLAYELVGTTVGEISTVRVTWRGPTTYTAADLLAEPAPPEEQSKLDEAIEWLRAELSGGPQLMTDVSKAARQAGIKVNYLQRARRRIATSKDGYQGKWVWTLKESTSPPCENLCTFGSFDAFGGDGSVVPGPKESKDVKEPKEPKDPPSASADTFGPEYRGVLVSFSESGWPGRCTGPPEDPSVHVIEVKHLRRCTALPVWKCTLKVGGFGGYYCDEHLPAVARAATGEREPGEEG
jgi:archaellum biogenesis ATPase FlaH